MNFFDRTGALAAMVLGIIAMAPASTPLGGIERHEALRHDLDTRGREIVQVHVAFGPGASFGMHTHPGVEVAYVLEGTLVYSFLDRPPVTLKAGESLYLPEGTAHAAHNPGNTRAAELATYLVAKGKPIVVMVPTQEAPKQAKPR